ncbi:TdeIII family type II restriction endonuclease [Thermococcus barophilus]|uniref:type II site-specific deoxyribonuclease n=1 Tax=Thermococcus barophilus TaxID=55802 RepID=A0A0S1XE98_THEBA|nr:TdeIII family type II restriction endonuclease [Thermococcus barophilus]ALM76066.1 Type-2 restriction enzyme [Thermococcus barophilus]
MKKSTKEKIWVYLEGFMQGLINKYDPKVLKDEVLEKILFDPKQGNYKPFHVALIPKELLRMQSFFRSFSTSLGQGVFEYIARIVAEDSGKWEKVLRNARFEATASSNVQSFVDKFLEDVVSKKVQPYPVSLPKPMDSAKKMIVVDLYLYDGEVHYFIEIKSPKPNKDQTRRTKEKFLYLLATYENAKTYYAFPYNPYGEEKSNYKWSFTKMYFDLNSEVLIGSEFWDFIGGRGTYSELLKLFRKFGEKRGREITKRLITGEG